MPDDLKVHDITMQDQVRLASGKATPVTHVTFYVGSHGPFMKDFEQGSATSDAIQAYIQAKVHELRGITQREY